MPKIHNMKQYNVSFNDEAMLLSLRKEIHHYPGSYVAAPFIHYHHLFQSY